MNKIIPVLLGADLNCYSVARAFHEAYGVCSYAFGKYRTGESTHSKIIKFKEVRNLEPDDYIIEVFCGVVDRDEELTEIISNKAIGWKIERISKISQAIMKLAIFEILYMDSIPSSVSINEAVELCKKYATQDDASFVNGILASVVKV